MTGVVDRFEGDIAVIILNESRRILEVPQSQLGPGIREGTWVKVFEQSNGLVLVTADAEATEQARRRIADKLARLRRGEHLKKNRLEGKSDNKDAKD